MQTYQNCEGKYGKLIMQELKLPAVHATPQAVASYEALGRKRIHWIDGDNMPGAFQMNTSWYFAPNREQQLNPDAETDVYTKWQPHVHDTDEMLCFYGSNPDDPYNLNGEIEIHIDGEPHILTKSSLIFLPAGLPHTPPLVNRVERPIFHFSIVLTSDYHFVTEGGEAFETR